MLVIVLSVLCLWVYRSTGETILCNSGLGACANTTQSCVEEGDCIFNCNANEGCQSADLCCLDGYYCEIFAERRRALRDAFIFCPDGAECNITGSTSQNYVYRNSEIHCGDNGICRFLFDAQTALNAFQFKFIDATNSSYLYAKRKGFITLTESLRRSNIFCPSSKKNIVGRTAPNLPQDTCYVDCLKPGTYGTGITNDSCTWLNVYAKDGFNDLYINDETTNVNITLYCGDSYEYSCSILSPDVTQCAGYNGLHECDYVAPTMYPTQLPTDMPTDDPTDDPTKHPTSYPSDSPSPAPTSDPTSSPTDVCAFICFCFYCKYS